MRYARKWRRPFHAKPTGWTMQKERTLRQRYLKRERHWTWSAYSWHIQCFGRCSHNRYGTITVTKHIYNTFWRRSISRWVSTGPFMYLSIPWSDRKVVLFRFIQIIVVLPHCIPFYFKVRSSSTSYFRSNHAHIIALYHNDNIDIRSFRSIRRRCVVLSRDKEVGVVYTDIITVIAKTEIF